MGVQLNHTVVWCVSKQQASAFFTELFGLPAATPFSQFLVVELSNGVTLDFLETDGKISMQHYAFLISEAEFDSIFGRICERGIAYWADPGKTSPGTINNHDGGRGVYFHDPDGHLLEIITRPYGGG